MTDYDGIILGAGHNALILQAYLGMAGMKTLCVERRDVIGGGLATMEDPRHPGFLHNTHSFFHRAIDRMPWYHDLNLAARGATYIEPELNVALITREGHTLEWWTDFEKTVASFEAMSPRDAQSLRRWRDAFLPIVEQILLPEAMSPPVPPQERLRKLERSAEGRLLLDTAALSPLEFVTREFENPTIQAGLLFFNGLREVDLRSKGFGHHIPFLLASPAKAQLCRGGSVRLAEALTRAVRETGGDIRTRTSIARIRVDAGRATGIETTDGEFIGARHFVASSLNPQQTFLDLLDEPHVPRDWREMATKFEYNLLAPLFALNVNLKAPPRYSDYVAGQSSGSQGSTSPAAGSSASSIDDAFMVILGLDHLDQFPEIVAHHEKGTVPPTVMWGACPTRFDPSQAPADMHTAFMWEKLPYALAGDPKSWDAASAAHGRDMLNLWKTYAPNLEDAVIDSFTRSPLDTERTLHNMRYGDLLVGAFSNNQVGYNRPFAGAGHYRAHLEGLYLCGSSSHPGGNVTGLPGYNAAKVLRADLGLA